MIVEEKSTLPQPGFFSHLIRLILHPRSAFEAILDAGGKTWIILASLGLVFAILPVVVAAPITSAQAREAIEAQMQVQAERGGEVSPEMQQQATQFASNPIFTVVFPSLGILFATVFGWLVWAGALHLLGTMLGGSNTFGQMWQVVVWAWLPFILRGMLQTIYILISGQVIAHPGLSGLVADTRSVTEILAAPPSSGELVLASLLARLDLFLIWNLVLLVIGVAVAARFSGRKAALITLGIWLVLTILGLIPTIASASFMSGMGG